MKGFVMNQNQIASMVGRTQQWVSLILTGRRRPSWAMAKKLSDNFGHSPAWWMEADIAKIRRVLRTDGSKRNGGQDDKQRRAA
jgi:plasmid maintenance system antidote protein VapI